jgi:hypothetical protein
MRILAIWLTAVVVAWQTGCAPVPPIVLQGSGADLQQLVGQWEGRYSGAPNGRSGSIAFTLLAGEDHAHGDVLMIPEGAERGYSQYPGLPLDDHERFSQILTIQFVRVQGGGISGTMEPYWDPDTKCTTSARFRGTVRGDVMEGTFTTGCGPRGRSVEGRWKVVRRVA